MDFCPAEYNSVNEFHMQEAEKLLQKIQEDLKSTPLNVIVDCGSGSGNVTRRLAQTLPHKRIIGLDIDPAMIEFAQRSNQSHSFNPNFDTDPSSSNNKRNINIEFIQQDVSLPWGEWSPALQELEGQVDLIWSNIALHWIHQSQRPQTARNLVRLLRPGGRLYLNITLRPNFNEFLPATERAENEKILKISSFQQQQDEWLKCFQTAGISPDNLSGTFRTVLWEGHSFSLEQLEGLSRMLKALLPLDLTSSERDEILTKLQKYWVPSLMTADGEPLVDEVRSPDGRLKPLYVRILTVVGKVTE